MKQSTKETLNVLGIIVGVLIFLIGTVFVVYTMRMVKQDIEYKAIIEYIEATKDVKK